VRDVAVRTRRDAQRDVITGRAAEHCDAVAETRLGTTVVVRPGRLEQGQYALIVLHDLSVQPRKLVDQSSL